MTATGLQTQFLALQAFSVPGAFRLEPFLEAAARFAGELEHSGVPTGSLAHTLDLFDDSRHSAPLDHTAAQAFIENARATGFMPRNEEDPAAFGRRLQEWIHKGSSPASSLPLGALGRLFLSRERMMDLFRDESRRHDLVPTYQLHRPLSGLSLDNTAEVYQAYDQVEGRLVALKIYRTFLPLQDIPLAGIFNELRFQSHPPTDDVVRAYLAGRTRTGEPYLALELMDGGSLRDVLKGIREGHPGEDFFRTVFPLARQMTTAVAMAHQHGILHRDVNPGNFFVNKGRTRVKLGDFGIAVREEEFGNYTPLIGSHNYRPPEYLDESRTEDAYTRDVYSLGLTLFELLTGLPAHRLRIAPATPPSRLLPDRGIPPEMDALVLRAVDPDPKRRPPTAVSMIEEMESFR